MKFLIEKERKKLIEDTEVGNVVIPEGTEHIDSWMFKNNTSLKSIDLQV